jgi:hypothetical protein
MVSQLRAIARFVYDSAGHFIDSPNKASDPVVRRRFRLMRLERAITARHCILEGILAEVGLDQAFADKIRHSDAGVENSLVGTV